MLSQQVRDNLYHAWAKKDAEMRYLREKLAKLEHDVGRLANYYYRSTDMTERCWDRARQEIKS